VGGGFSDRSIAQAGRIFMKAFIRRQEENLAMRLLLWQYQRLNLPVPASSDMERRAAELVEDAHRIARERGKNVLVILKEMAAGIKK
jgi:hypothetical protein